MTNCSRYELFVLLYRFRVSNLGSKEIFKLSILKSFFLLKNSITATSNAVNSALLFCSAFRWGKDYFVNTKLFWFEFWKESHAPDFVVLVSSCFDAILDHWLTPNVLDFFQYELSCSISILTSFYLVFSAVVRFSLGWILVGRKR